MKKLLCLTLWALLFLMASCKSYKDIPYFTNIPSDSVAYVNGHTTKSVDYKALLIKPDDILQVDISLMDNRLSALNTTPTGNTLEAETRGAIGYLVDKDGSINLPLLGKITVAGKTTNQVKDEIQSKASSFYNNPIVNVRISNFAISVLGEVARPGTYYIKGERASVLDALGLAGDMTIFGRRDNILLVRQLTGGLLYIRLNINDGQLAESPYFYLQQNDVLYIEPAKAKAAQTDAQRMQWLSFSASMATIVAVVLTRVNWK